MKSKTYFTTVDIALVSVFCALWVILNLTLGRLGFTWFGLPIFCDLSVFLTLLLVTWATGKFGAASIVGLIGATVALLITGSWHNIGFGLSAILFDILMFVNRHKIQLKAYNLITTALATIVSAYFAGVIIGTVFMSRSIEWALTFWGGWHLTGGIIGIIVTFPIIGVLEKANVKGIKGA
ncbi:MAG: hypothetical protein ACUVTB_02660 [Candidatus Bathycorpusculaceae bacterium]